MAATLQLMKGGVWPVGRMLMSSTVPGRQPLTSRVMPSFLADRNYCTSVTTTTCDRHSSRHDRSHSYSPINHSKYCVRLTGISDGHVSAKIPSVFVSQRFMCTSSRPKSSGKSGMRKKLQSQEKGSTSKTEKVIKKDTGPKHVLVSDRAFKPVVAYAVATEINLQKLRTELTNQNLYRVVDLPEDVEGTLFAEAVYNVNGESREFFVFEDGALVCWNMLETERLQIVKSLMALSYFPNSFDVIVEEEESLKAVGNSQTKLVGDEIHLNDSLQSKDEITLEKFAFSNAMAQSVKLSLWEEQLHSLVDAIEPYLENMKGSRRSQPTSSEVHRNLGKMFTLRHEMNLESGLLDTPEVYWDREPLEILYRQMHNYLSIQKRTKVMNEKLTYCNDLLQLMNTHLTDKKHVRLEIYIVALIVIEVLFECAPYVKSFLER